MARERGLAASWIIAMAVAAAAGAAGPDCGPQFRADLADRTLRVDLFHAGDAVRELVIVMVNHSRYGGGGIYRSVTTFTTANRWSEYLLVHELGHCLAGLADEYYTSNVASTQLHAAGREPDAPNITALLDPAALKWRDLVAADTPLPTPWNQSEFDRIEVPYQQRRRELDGQIAAAARAGAPESEIAALEAEQERLAVDDARRVAALLAGEPYHGRVGAFQGAGYAATGLYRPALDCIMFSRTGARFCPVCERAVADAILRAAGVEPPPRAAAAAPTGGDS